MGESDSLPKTANFDAAKSDSLPKTANFDAAESDSLYLRQTILFANACSTISTADGNC